MTARHFAPDKSITNALCFYLQRRAGGTQGCSVQKGELGVLSSSTGQPVIYRPVTSLVGSVFLLSLTPRLSFQLCALKINSYFLCVIVDAVTKFLDDNILLA